MLLLVNLPLDLIKYLQTFLSHDDKHYFLNSNKLHFSSLKRETIYFSLNEEKSREYVEDERFREMILSKVKDGSKQIGLCFHENYKVSDIRDIVAHKINVGEIRYPYFPDKVSSLVYTLRSEITKIPFLPMLEEVRLHKCMNIKDFSNLSHLKSLELEDAYHLTDITPLQNIPHLTFNNCRNLRDFSTLSSRKQRFLAIYKSSLSSLYFLRNMLTVELIQCDQLADVSPLHGIKDLILINCSRIRDISCLGNHHRLTIAQCPSIQRGYECFRTVRRVRVSELEVSDLSVFLEVKALRIKVFKSMESQLYLLRDIPKLELIPSKNEVYNVSQLNNIRLKIHYNIINITNCDFSSQLLHLVLVNCPQIVQILNEGNIPIFRNLQSLHILISFSIEHLNGLGDIPTLIVESCSELRNISSLGRNKCVKLKYCPKIRDVSSLATVPNVTLSFCDGIVDFSCLSSVPRLKIVR